MALLERVSALVRANLNDLIDRAVGYRNMAENFEQEIAHQKTQVENLKSALHKLDLKLGEAHAKSELLLAQHRRSRALSKASKAQMTATDQTRMGTFDRMKDRVHGEEAMSHALAEMAGDNMEDRLDALGKDDEVERMLADMKNRKGVA